MIVQLLQFSSDPNLSCKMKPGWKPGWRSNSKCYFNLNALDKLQVSHIQEQSRNDEGNIRNNVCSSSGLSWDVSKTTSSLKTNNSETKNYLHEKKKNAMAFASLKVLAKRCICPLEFSSAQPKHVPKGCVKLYGALAEAGRVHVGKGEYPCLYIPHLHHWAGLPDNLCYDRRKWGKKNSSVPAMEVIGTKIMMTQNQYPERPSGSW